MISGDAIENSKTNLAATIIERPGPTLLLPKKKIKTVKQK